MAPKTPAFTPAPLSTQSRMLRQLFSFFRQESIRYCVVGNVESLPDEVPSDVDMVVDPGTLPNVPRLLHRFGLSSGTRIVQCIQHEPVAFQYVLAWHREDGAPRFLQVDVCSHYVRRGRRYLAAHELLGNRVYVRGQTGDGPARRGERPRARTPSPQNRRPSSLPIGFYVAAPADEFVYYLIKKIDKGHLTPSHGQHLSNKWRDDPKGCHAQLERFWAGPYLDMLATAAHQGDWHEVDDAILELRDALHRRVRRTPVDAARSLRRVAQRVRRPTGLFIALLGPDGSGKTSVIEGLRARLAPVFRRTSTAHFLPHRTSNTDAPVTSPHATPPRGWAASLAKLLYYGLATGFGHLVQVRPRLVQSTLVLFDRHLADLHIDPRRYRYSGPLWLARWACALAPSPSLLIVLDAPVAVLHDRTPEVDPSEAARLRARYRLWAAQHAHAHVVDTTAPLDAVIDEVTDLILDRLADRTARRLRLPVAPNRTASGSGSADSIPPAPSGPPAEPAKQADLPDPTHPIEPRSEGSAASKPQSEPQ